LILKLVILRQQDIVTEA